MITKETKKKESDYPDLDSTCCLDTCATAQMAEGQDIYCLIDYLDFLKIFLSKA